MEHKLFKVTLLGEGAVGKTSLRRQYLGESFEKSYAMTIGADFATKRVILDHVEYTIVIWDLAGQTRFKEVRESYYRGTKGALLVFDLSRGDTFQMLASWIEELLINNNNNKKIPMVLVGNKSDLRGSSIKTIPSSFGEDYAEQLSIWSGFKIPYIETSAQNGDNVEPAFKTLIEQLTKQTYGEEIELR